MFKLGSGANAPLPAPFTLRTPLTMSALHRPCAPSLVVALLILTGLGILYHKDKYRQAICNDQYRSEACCGLPCCQSPNSTDLPIHTPMNLATDINDKGPLGHHKYDNSFSPPPPPTVGERKRVPVWPPR